MAKIDALVDSMSAVKDRSVQMFQPIHSQSAIGYTRSLERILDFMSDMREVQLPQKLTKDYKISMNVEEVARQIERMGSVTFPGETNVFGGTMGQTMNMSADFSLITNDFSKPKNKIQNSRIIPEIAQSIKILKVLPHFKESTLLFRLSKETLNNEGFHQKCDN